MFTNELPALVYVWTSCFCAIPSIISLTVFTTSIMTSNICVVFVLLVGSTVDLWQLISVHTNDILWLVFVDLFFLRVQHECIWICHPEVLWGTLRVNSAGPFYVDLLHPCKCYWDFILVFRIKSAMFFLNFSAVMENLKKKCHA